MSQLYIFITFLLFVLLIYFLWITKKALPFAARSKKVFVQFIGIYILFLSIFGYSFLPNYMRVSSGLIAGMFGIALMHLQIKLSPFVIKIIFGFVLMVIALSSWWLNFNGAIPFFGIIIGAAVYGAATIVCIISESM